MDSYNFEELMAKILEQETSDDIQEIRKLILKRIATESDVKQARIPAPMNITEIGGYYNLIANDDVMRRQMLAQILGLPYISGE